MRRISYSISSAIIVMSQVSYSIQEPLPHNETTYHSNTQQQQHRCANCNKPSTALIAAINFANMAHCMIDIACDPYNKDNVVLQLHNLVQGMANIAIAGSRSISGIEAASDHYYPSHDEIIAALSTSEAGEIITTYIEEHRDTLQKYGTHPLNASLEEHELVQGLIFHVALQLRHLHGTRHAIVISPTYEHIAASLEASMCL